MDFVITDEDLPDGTWREMGLAWSIEGTSGAYVDSTDVLEYAVDGQVGTTTYQLAVTLGADALNVYSIFGTGDGPMEMPAAWQWEGDRMSDAHVGGCYAAEEGVFEGIEFDSFLTVGATSGNLYPDDFPDSEKRGTPRLGHAGIDDELNAWDENTALTSSDGLVFWLDPHDGPMADFVDNVGAENDKIVVAQLTVATGLSFTATTNLQGRMLGEFGELESDAWRVMGATWSVEGSEPAQCWDENDLAGTACADADCLAQYVTYFATTNELDEDTAALLVNTICEGGGGEGGR